MKKSVYTMALLLSVSFALQAATGIKNLRVEYLKNPVGIDAPNPLFSWEMQSDVTGAKQTAYEIRLFTGNTETPFWESGKIESDRSVGIAYGGSPLSPSTRYRWTVDVWDESDAIILSAENAYFETGLMQSGWSDAKWLKIKDKTQDTAPANFTLSCDVTVIDQNAGVIFGAQDANNMYMWAINTYQVSHPILRRHIFVNGNVTVVNDIPLPAQFTTAQIIGHERHLKIEAANNVVKTYLDDVLVDTYGNSALRNGYIGFRVYTGDNSTHEHAYIDNVAYNYTESGVPQTFTEDFENGSNDFDGVNTILVNGNSKMDLHSQGNADLRVLQSAAQGIPMFRTEFTLAKAVKSARIYSSALGVYDLFINGQRVGTPQPDGTTVYDELKPGWTDYRKTVFYSTYDIASLLVTGANAVGAEVTSGWFTGNIAHNEYGQHPLAFRAKILLEYTDGTSETIVTNPASWKASANSPIRMAAIYDGETYDARKESGWTTAGFDDSGWNATEINDYFTGDVLAFIGQPVRVRSELEQTPKSITVYNGTTPNGTTYGAVSVVRTLNNVNSFTLDKGETAIVDFGQNFVGWPDFKVTGARGTKLIARFAEMLNDSGDERRGNDGAQGTVYLRNLRSAKATLRYTLKGDAAGETFHPSMTFFGFRYCERTATENITVENLKGEVVGNANEENSAFATNNELVNKLYGNVQWGQRGNFLSVPTDCPQRDERLGWMGDTQIFSRAASYNADVLPFFRKWAKDVRDSQQADGTYPSVVPDTWNVGYGRTAWAEAGIIVPWNMYLMYGDSQLLDEQYDSMEKFMDWMATRQFDGYLYNGGDTQYGDWLAYEATDARFISVCYYAYAAQLMSKIAAALNKTPDVAKYRTLYDNIKAEFQRRYVSSRTGTLSVSSQTSYLLALQNDLFSDSAKTQSALTALTGKIQSNGNKLSTGFVGTGILNQTLSEYGANDVAYNLLLQRENPSWLYSVDQGATTIWERWNSYTIASGFGDPGMNSFNHYSYGAVSEWFFRFMAGIEADESVPGFKHFVLQPVPDTRNVAENEKITNVSAEYGSYYGKIKSQWERKADGIYRYTVTVPANTSATLYLPKCNGAVCVTQNGVTAGNVEGVTSYVVENERFVIELESGSYVFDTPNTGESIEKQLKKNAELKIYPNPVKNELKIDKGERGTRNENGNLQITDISGKTVINQEMSFVGYPLSINVRSLSAGVYFLKVGDFQGKFVKE
jgi:alpha-L-rhamnosidase